MEKSRMEEKIKEEEFCCFNVEDSNKTLKVKALPLWRGISNFPSQSVLKMDLTLELHPFGFIKQLGPFEQVVLAYEKDDYHFITAPPGYSQWSNAIAKRNMDFFCNRVDFSQINSVLEIGAGSFYLANALINQYSISRYVIFDPAIKEVSADNRIEFRKEYFNDSNQLLKKVDFIISISCLEHVSDPFNFLTALQESLTEDGLAFIAFPDIEQQFMTGDLGALLHEHISYFTYFSAETLLKRAGFNVLQYDRKNDMHKFLLSRGKKIINNEILSFQFLSNAGNQLQKSLMRAKYLIEIDLRNGKSVAIHGGCNATFNFLHLSNLIHSNNIWIFDNDQTKEGKYLPSFKKAIRHSLDPLYLKMDKIYIGAMTFWEEIKNSLVAFGINESKIFPLFPRWPYENQ